MDFVTPLLGLLVPHLPALLMKAAEDVVGEGAKKAVYEAVPGNNSKFNNFSAHN